MHMSVEPGLIREMEEVARKATLKAGKLIAGRLGKVPLSSVQNKGPSDYVTEVDKEAEALILDSVSRSFPGHRLVSEEANLARIGNGIQWIIDPLDGTTNFIHGFPFVAVSVAVYEGLQPLLGFVLDPLREELFHAVRGGGAFLNGSPLRVRERFTVEQALIATGFPFRMKRILDPYLAAFSSILRQVSGIRRAGSAALDLAYVAAGRVDGFWEAGLAPWDVAAGSLLVLEAGGRVDDFWGEGAYLLNGHIVAGTPLVHPFLRERIGEHLAPALKTGEQGGKTV